MATYADLYIDRGCTFQRTLDLTDQSNEGISLSGYTGTGSIRKTYSSTSKTDFTVNTSGDDLVISLSKEQTKSLKAGRYVYDIIIDNGTKRIKVLEGQLHVEDSVTFDSP
jgi:hypothetical protein